METMNIALPDALKSFVKERVAAGGFGTVSEYVRDLIRADKKQLAKQQVEAEILRGLASGEPRPITRRDWQQLHSKISKRRGKR
jgi:antitoxin ParD1/3/4